MNDDYDKMSILELAGALKRSLECIKVIKATPSLDLSNWPTGGNA